MCCFVCYSERAHDKKEGRMRSLFGCVHCVALCEKKGGRGMENATRELCTRSVHVYTDDIIRVYLSGVISDEFQ